MLFLQVLYSLSDKVIHQNHEVIKGENKIFFLMRNLEISPYSYSGCGFANETFPNLSWWMNVFAFYLNMYVPFFLFACAGLVRTNGYLVFDIIQYCKDMFIWRYRTCCTAALTCRNWSIIMNADTSTVRILINTCLWDDNSFNKAIF